MRLLFLNRSFPVLSQTFVLDQIAYAVDAGHETTVAALKLSSGVHHNVVERLKLYNKLLYSRPVDFRNVRRVVTGAVTDFKRASGFFQRSALGRPTLTETSIAVQLEHDPDVIIAHFGPTGISAVRLKKAFFPKARVVVVFHGYDVSGYVQKRGWSNYERMADGVDLAVCVNAHWAELLRRKTAMSNVVVHHLGVDCRKISRRPTNRSIAHEGLFVGRMVEKKGFDHLIAAAASLAARGISLRIHAIGAGPLLGRYQSIVRDRNLDHAFVFHGEQRHDTVLTMMKEADFLVAPSVTGQDGDQEGIPVVLMEAMASGLPVIATRHSGIPELVTDGETGLLVDERDDTALADRIEMLIRHPDLGDRLAAAASDHVREHFNAVTQNARFFRLVEGLSQ
jgi:colanic acid/amylovoran biosynthesis glycosyltransferase